MRRFLPALILALTVAAPVLTAQDAATVEGLAPILATEDARLFDPALLGAALRSPDSVVQRYALRAIGRIGDPAGIPMLLEYLANPDSGLDAEAVFSLGLLRDSAAVTPIVAWLTGPVAISQAAALEAATALARIGGPAAAQFLGDALADPSRIKAPDPAAFQQRVVAEAWRLGRRAPVELIEDAARPGAAGDRAAAAYSLARLHPRDAASLLLQLSRDQVTAVRAEAVKALTRTFADSAGLARGDVLSALRSAIGDPDPGLVINALRSLATFGDSTTAGDVIPLLDAGIANVDVQAAEALGRIGGSRARDALGRAVRQGRSWAVRRAALLALARVDGAGFREAAPTWSRSSDWRNRAAAAEGWAIASPGAPPADLLNDRDGRVVAAALSAWAGAVHGAPADLLAAGRAHLADQDPAARGAAADIVGRAPSALDAGPLVAAWHRSARDSFPDAGESALGALHHLATLPEGATARAFAGTEPSPADYQLRAWAEQNWPELADHWGPSTPIRTGRTLEDYRALARRFIVAPDSLRNPLVTVDVEGRGTLTLKLFGADAPLTVANFLRLVDARYFDGDRFHRVVPNFVVQDGDPRGDGNGGPGYAIRDEINTHRYGSGTVGMALSGPDTGGSQWFITLSPQPHLDGNYTVFGEVTSGTATLARIVQGDLIRSVHR